LSRPREVHARDGGIRDLVGIGVRIDDERVLAAEFERERLDSGLCGRALDRMPVGTEPVNEMRLTRGWRTMASPAGTPLPLTMLTVPGGMISLQICPRIEARASLSPAA